VIKDKVATPNVRAFKTDAKLSFTPSILGKFLMINQTVIKKNDPINSITTSIPVNESSLQRYNSPSFIIYGHKVYTSGLKIFA